MSRNYAELEQEMIADLAQRTGRDLAQWMAAIKAAGLADKNAIIDWLRPQGMTFAHASWLERIHNNGGRPIYLDAARPGRSAPAAPPTMAVDPRRTSPAPPVAVPAPTSPSSADAEQLRQLMAKAKAYRPLAELVVAGVGRAMPGVAAKTVDDLIVFERPFALAVLWISPRELRLGLDLGDQPFEPPLSKAKLPGTPARFSHMLVLTDARQVGVALLDLVRQSDARANPPPPGA